MDQAKEEPVPEDASTSHDTNVPSTGSRGRGRGRGRGRRVIPRQVVRRKPPPGQAPKPIDVTSARGRGRGRGNDRGRGQNSETGGRGRGRGAPVHSPNVVGLGQIAPPRPGVSRIASSGGSAVSSRRSSAVSSVSIGAASAASSTYSFGPGTSSFASDDAASASASFPPDMVFPSEPEPSTKKGSKKSVEPMFREHTLRSPDSDDDMPDDTFDVRNCDIAPYPGHVTDNGILLPVSLPGLRALPSEFREFDGVSEPTVESTVKPEPLDSVSAKDEPTEVENIDTALSSLHLPPAEAFPQDSVARTILSSPDSLAFMQIPGLLPLTEHTTKSKKEDEKTAETSSVAEAIAASERLRALGVDLRSVGTPGANIPVGKLRIHKSGRVTIMFSNGSCIDLEHGINPKVCQQVVLINCKEKTCEELQNTIPRRYVAVPSLGTG